MKCDLFRTELFHYFSRTPVHSPCCGRVGSSDNAGNLLLGTSLPQILPHVLVHGQLGGVFWLEVCGIPSAFTRDGQIRNKCIGVVCGRGSALLTLASAVGLMTSTLHCDLTSASVRWVRGDYTHVPRLPYTKVLTSWSMISSLSFQDRNFKHARSRCPRKMLDPSGKAAL